MRHHQINVESAWALGQTSAVEHWWLRQIRPVEHWWLGQTSDVEHWWLDRTSDVNAYEVGQSAFDQCSRLVQKRDKCSKAACQPARLEIKA